MSDDPKITVDDMLRKLRPRHVSLAASTDPDYFEAFLFGAARPTRRRFDPRRLTERWRRKPVVVPVPGGRVVYDDEVTSLGTALTSAEEGEVVIIDLETPAMAAERILREAE